MEQEEIKSRERSGVPALRTGQTRTLDRDGGPLRQWACSVMATKSTTFAIN